jgi:hypothetical protein
LNSIPSRLYEKTSFVKTTLLLSAVLAANCSIALAQSLDKNKPYGRVAIGVINTANGDENAFETNGAPGKGRKLVAHFDATAKCDVLVAAFGSGQLAYGWRPQFTEVSAGHEMQLPKAPVTWSWEKAAGKIEVYVLFFAPGSKDGAELRTLVAAMQSQQSEAVTKLQVNKLRELIGRAKVDKGTSDRGAKADSTEVGGVFRMVIGFPWRDSARSVNFSADRPGALIFSNAR